jgi:hypothetical protein
VRREPHPLYVLDRSVESLLEAIRSSTLPSLADDIETHLQAGKVPLFEKKPDQFGELEEKRVAVLVAKDRSRSAPVEVNPTDEELSTPYTPDEQIDEAIRLVRERLEATVEITQDINRITESLGVPAVDLIYMTGDEVDRLTTQNQAAASLNRWNDISSQVRSWMESERTATSPDAE